MASFLVSVIIPVYNEEENIGKVLMRLKDAVESYNHELIFVNDGSSDKTAEILKDEAKKDRHIKLISFYRNYGHQAALTAGYNHAKGDCVVSIDADGQDPPEIIKEMVEKWSAGAKIVYARRANRETDGFMKRTTAHLFYKWINFLSDVSIPKEVGDFRLLDREVVGYLNNLPEQSRFLRGLVAWGGHPAAYVEFKREKRIAGHTHYTLPKMINLALDGITSFSTKPLRMAIYLGFITSGFSILVVFIKVTQHIFFPSSDWLPGWASLFFSIVFLGGVQLITIGIIGEYIGKIYKEVQKRPQYLIKELVNV